MGPNEFDVIILGGGPAGLSASLYTLRAGLSTLIFARDDGALSKAHLVENYFGFAEPTTGQALLDDSRRNALRLGAAWEDAEVLSITMTEDGRFAIAARQGEILAKAVLLATGKTYQAAPFRLDRLIGGGVSRCAVCDGFFYRGKPVGVLGEGNYALAEAEELLPLASSVTLFTNGKEPAFSRRPAGLSINTAPLAGAATETNPLTGAEQLTGLMEKSGALVPMAGLFLALGTPGASDFASRLGLMTENGSIAVDENGQTNIPGIFAAGDCTGAPYQISVAVGRGALAGMAMAEFLRAKNKLYG